MCSSLIFGDYSIKNNPKGTEIAFRDRAGDWETRKALGKQGMYLKLPFPPEKKLRFPQNLLLGSGVIIFHVPLFRWKHLDLHSSPNLGKIPSRSSSFFPQQHFAYFNLPRLFPGFPIKIPIPIGCCNPSKQQKRGSEL